MLVKSDLPPPNDQGTSVMTHSAKFAPWPEVATTKRSGAVSLIDDSSHHLSNAAAQFVAGHVSRLCGLTF